MTTLPALIKGWQGKRYHIAVEEIDKSFRTQCGRTINSLTEGSVVYLADEIICPRCGGMVDYEAINNQRQAEEAARQAEHRRILEANRISLEAHNAVRPVLVNDIEMQLSHMINPEDGPTRKDYLNMTSLEFYTWVDTQRFTVKIEIWNGKH